MSAVLSGNIENIVLMKISQKERLLKLFGMWLVGAACWFFVFFYILMLSVNSKKVNRVTGFASLILRNFCALPWYFPRIRDRPLSYPACCCRCVRCWDGEHDCADCELLFNRSELHWRWGLLFFYEWASWIATSWCVSKSQTRYSSLLMISQVRFCLWIRVHLRLSVSAVSLAIFR